MKKSLVIISGCWPGYRKGYEIACRATIELVCGTYEKVIYIGPSAETLIRDKGLPKNIEFHNGGFQRRSKSVRFALSLLSPLPAITVRFWKSRKRVRLIISQAELEAFDIIYEDIPTSYLMADLMSLYPSAQHIVRSHNVVFDAFSGLVARSNFLLSLLWRFEVARIKRFELEVARKASKFISISEKDAQTYNRFGVSVSGVVDVYIDSLANLAGVGDLNSVLFLGTADLRKGAALSDFIGHAWPIIKMACPRAKLLLGGAGTKGYSNSEADIYGLGFIDDETEFMSSGQVFINPQVVGSGVKLKSIMAMMFGKTLVSTEVGIEGIPAEPDKHYLIAKEYSAMAEIIIGLLHDRQRCEKIGNNAHSWADDHYSFEQYEKRCGRCF